MASPGMLHALYRGRQFWTALRARPGNQDLAMARSMLTPAQMALFDRLQPSEQVHSLGVLRKLLAESSAAQSSDLLVAALLHDVGKIRLPLRLWERVWIVLVERLAPGSLARWGSRSYQDGQRLPAWQRPLVVARQHPAWGARLVEQAGASPLTANLVRRHQQKLSGPTSSLEDMLLARLQAVDDQN